MGETPIVFEKGTARCVAQAAGPVAMVLAIATLVCVAGMRGRPYAAAYLGLTP